MSMMTSWTLLLFLARSQIVPIQSATFPMEIFTLQSACSYYCPPWSPYPHVDCFSAIALQHNYVLLVGQPLTDFSRLSHCIPFRPSSWFSARKFCLLALLPLMYFSQIKSWYIIRLKKSYLVIFVSPESSAYGPIIPLPCQVFLLKSFLVLPPLHCLQYSTLSHPSDAILEWYHALDPAMEHSEGAYAMR